MRRPVQLPVYGLPQLDQAALHAWRSTGDRVVPLGARPIEVQGKQIYPMLAVSSRKGALRCLTLVLNRSIARRSQAAASR